MKKWGLKMKTEELMNLRYSLAANKSVLDVLQLLRDIKYNAAHDTKRELKLNRVRRACDELQKLLSESAAVVNEVIPPLRTMGDDFVYSVRSAEYPPFVVKTNDSDVIEQIYQLLMRIGGWENAKFLLENLRLNDSQELPSERKFVVGDIVRHFKGKYYIILNFTAINCSTHESYVIYASYGNKSPKDEDGNAQLFVRKQSEFMSKVDREKYPNAEQTYRFEYSSHVPLEVPTFENGECDL